LNPVEDVYNIYCKFFSFVRHGRCKREAFTDGFQKTPVLGKVDVVYIHLRCEYTEQAPIENKADESRACPMHQIASEVS
jgi:hypothetical protein